MRGLSSVGRASDSSPEGHRFKSGSPHFDFFVHCYPNMSFVLFVSPNIKNAMHMKKIEMRIPKQIDILTPACSFTPAIHGCHWTETAQA